MRAWALSACLMLVAGPLAADARVTVLMDALKIREITAILQDEGMIYGTFLDADMLNGKGGPFFAGQVRRIYDRERMEEAIRQTIDDSLSDADLQAAIGFFATEDGARIVTLENEARRLMADPDIEEQARAAYDAQAGSDTPRVMLLTRYIRVNDLLENNVANALSANYQFQLGLSDGGYRKRSEDDILREVWSEQEDIRADTESWLYGYLLMAYEPLSLDLLEDYVDFADSPAGRRLNAALFTGFEGVYGDISYALGRAISLMAKGDEI